MNCRLFKRVISIAIKAYVREISELIDFEIVYCQFIVTLLLSRTDI